MTAVADCLRLEYEQAERNIGELKELGVCGDAVVWYCHELANAGKGVGRESVASLARLLADSLVHIEQAIVCTVRGQPRLGWASMRLAAEALKDLDAIDREPALHDLWLSIGNCQTAEEIQAAQKRFAERRRILGPSPITKVCQECMEVASRLGSHANATSWFTFGPLTESSPDTLSLPNRLSDPATLCAHIQHLARHGFQLLAMLSGFRLKHLTPKEAEQLRPKFSHAFKAFRKHFPEVQIRRYEP